MSGPESCKTKPGTGAQHVANGRVAEMIELATVVTNYPAATQARVALARIANELLRRGADATIDQAIEATPSGGVAQTLQHAVEAASERVVVRRNGIRAELLLFALPIITTFEQNVPESQFESALSGVNGLKDLPNSTKDGGLARAQMVLLPKLFRLEDLNAMPLSLVQKRAINLGTDAVSRGSEWHSYTAQKGSFKRSTAFLRFLVGQRPLLEHEDWIAGEIQLCERLQDLTKQAIKRSLGLPCCVHAIYVNSFYEGLYSGMWLYQEKRLDQLARASCAQIRRKKSLEAKIVAYGRRHRFEMCVGFFVGDETVGGHVYRLSSRPSEDPSGCVSRIASRLEAAGITANAFTNFVPEKEGFGLRTGRTAGASMITIPI